MHDDTLIMVALGMTSSSSVNGGMLAFVTALKMSRHTRRSEKKSFSRKQRIMCGRNNSVGILFIVMT